MSRRRKTIKFPQRSNSNRRTFRQQDDKGRRWQCAERVENDMIQTLEVIQKRSIANNSTRNNDDDSSILHLIAIAFPSVRDCNTAIATFGDGGDFLRALRLFVKMRKAASLGQKLQATTTTTTTWNVPAPTLVTYSTLMSRAIGQFGRPQLALRLWNLMKLQAEFWSNPKDSSSNSNSISHSNDDVFLIPDVKAANILMNAHAKLANVEQAFDLMRQMKYGNGTDVPLMTPNIVTYNTLLDACHKAGKLDSALVAKDMLEKESTIMPDARTYTSLIATVARKVSHVSGANDPSPAFALLEEMKTRNILPNGATYSALIDVCGRCHRPDLALQGLRIMLRQKADEHGGGRLANEVGAWTAAIDACGKAGRIQTARRIFWFMVNDCDVRPNTITCGCLTDCLLKNARTAETLEVLRYMKREGIVPSKVMYTSLMTSAGKLVQIENQQSPLEADSTTDEHATKAIEVYTELMMSLMRGNTNKKGNGGESIRTSQSDEADSNALLVKVFLIFQEMKGVGATPDLACYNALLRACARAGDVSKAKDVLKRIREDGLHPNDNSWRELIRAAAKTRRSDLAESMWSMALEYRGDDDDNDNSNPYLWHPSPESFGALASAYLRHASSTRQTGLKRKFYRKVISMYKDVLVGKEDRRLNLIGRDTLQENPRSMMLVLQAIVGLVDLLPNNPTTLCDLATSIVQLDCFAADGAPPPRVYKDNRSASHALSVARSWLYNENEKQHA